MRFFLTQRKKIEKFGILGENFPDPEVADKKIARPDPGQKFPLKSTNFSIFSLGLKNLIVSGQRWVGLLYTAGQKYAWVG